MGNKIFELNDENFADTIGSGVTLVDFWAPWCGPCLMQGPIVEQIAEKIDGKAKVAKMNVDDSMQTAMQYRIQSIPTIMVFKDGEVAGQMVGVQSEHQLMQALERALQ